MKIAKMLKTVDAGWTCKKKGYRVVFESWVDDTCTIDAMPDKADAPLVSDVVAWRSAWKLAQASVPGNPILDGAALFNITVVDSEGAPVPHYVSGQYKIYNRRDGDKK